MGHCSFCKQNCWLNRSWSSQKKYGKRQTAKARRRWGRSDIKERLDEKHKERGR